MPLKLSRVPNGPGSRMLMNGLELPSIVALGTLMVTVGLPNSLSSTMGWDLGTAYAPECVRRRRKRRRTRGGKGPKDHILRCREGGQRSE